MRIVFITIVYVLFGILIIAGGRQVNSLIEDIGLWVSFFVIVRYRHYIAELLANIHLPRWVIYLVSALPFMLVEENVNCLPTGCTLVPPTIPMLVIFLVIVYFVTLKIRAPKFWYILGGACAVGLLWEWFVGAAHTAFFALPLFWFVYVSIWTLMSYAYFTVIPLTYLLSKK